MTTRYYEATGEVKKKIQKWIDDREEAIYQAFKFVESFGAKGFQRINGVFVQEQMGGFIFPEDAEPDPKQFRKHYNKSERRHDDWYVPNRSTKEGKALDKEMKKHTFPSGGDMAAIIGMDPFDGNRWRTPGMKVIGKRIILSVPDNVTPKGCRRISDTKVEELEKKHAA